MDYTCRTKTLQSIAKDIAKCRIVLSHKLQRKEGQWNKQQKSDLIDSLLRKYPINPTYSIKESDTLSVIDGVQRLSTVRDYLNDVFALSKTLEPVIVHNETKEIAGKKFSKLLSYRFMNLLAALKKMFVKCSEGKMPEKHYLTVNSELYEKLMN